MGRKDASWLRALAACSAVALALGCGDDPARQTSGDAGRADAGDAAAGIDCTGADPSAGEAPAIETCAIASCHNPDFAGQRGGLGFASSNLTPDPTGIAGWTLEEVAIATLDGIGRDGEVLCPIMIRYRTAGMTEAEACDIAAYLLQLEPIENEVPDTCN